jgi:hypothetical protein
MLRHNTDRHQGSVDDISPLRILTTNQTVNQITLALLTIWAFCMLKEVEERLAEHHAVQYYCLTLITNCKHLSNARLVQSSLCVVVFLLSPVTHLYVAVISSAVLGSMPSVCHHFYQSGGVGCEKWIYVAWGVSATQCWWHNFCVIDKFVIIISLRLVWSLYHCLVSTSIQRWHCVLYVRRMFATNRQSVTLLSTYTRSWASGPLVTVSTSPSYFEISATNIIFCWS